MAVTGTHFTKTFHRRKDWFKEIAHEKTWSFGESGGGGDGSAVGSSSAFSGSASGSAAGGSVNLISFCEN